MRKKSKILTKILLLMLVLLMTLTSIQITTAGAASFTSTQVAARSSSVTKVEKTYDIAIVFDNSGSMYGGSFYWCRAKYAMEIFASMLNYDTDKLTIFPMWEVVTDGSTPDSGGSYAAIEIRSKSDIDKISNMFTVNPSHTPFEPVIEAYDYLQSSSAEEKWLIVLADGIFNFDTRENANNYINSGETKYKTDYKKDNKLHKDLLALASDSIKVQYIGFGQAVDLSSESNRNFFAKSSTDSSLKDDLVEICNMIFQRSILPDNRRVGKTLNLDLSMKSIIVFAQGDGAKITSLKNADGKEIPVILDSGQRKYSELSCDDAIYGGPQPGPKVDKTLAGQVVTFGACEKGEYTLEYSGAEAIQIFYEPDVDIEVKLTANDGSVIDGSDELIEGNYHISSKIIDAETGDDVTNHELLGSDVKLRTRVKTSGDSDYKDYPNNADITLSEDSKTEILIEGEYLGMYTITSKDSASLEWMREIKVRKPAVDFKISMTAAEKEYVIADHNNWEPFRVSMTADGIPLTKEEMDRTTFTIFPADGINYRFEKLSDESAYLVYIAQDESGEFVAPEKGVYNLKVAAKFVAENGEEVVSNSQEASVNVQKFSALVRTLTVIFIILIILIILAIITFILHKIKVFPNNVTTSNSVYKKSGHQAGSAVANLNVNSKNLFKKKGTMSVRATRGNMGVVFAVEAIHPLFKFPFKFQKSARRNYRIVGITGNGMDYVKINGNTYKSDTFSQAKERCNDSTTIEFEKRVKGEKYYLKTDVINKK